MYSIVKKKINLKKKKDLQYSSSFIRAELLIPENNIVLIINIIKILTSKELVSECRLKNC